VGEEKAQPLPASPPVAPIEEAPPELLDNGEQVLPVMEGDGTKRSQARGDQTDGSAGASAVGLLAAPAIATSPFDDQAARDRLQKEAEQLAAHLRQREHDLAERESRLHAQLALLERERRMERFWFDEQEAALQRRSEELSVRERELHSRLARLAAAEAAQTKAARVAAEVFRKAEELEAAVARLESRRKELDERETALLVERQKLDTQRLATEELARQLMVNIERRREAVEQQAAAVEAQAESLRQQAAALAEQKRAQEGEDTAEADRLETREHELRLRERRLADAEAELAELRSQWQAEQQRLQEELAAQRRRLEADQQQAAIHLRQRQEALQRRGEELDRSREALRRQRAELLQLHRETLEIRLATEELWTEIFRTMPPAPLNASLARIRQKLAEHYRAAEAELQEQKAELEAIRQQLTLQYEKLCEQKQLWERSVAAQQEQIRKLTLHLETREKELAGRAAALEERAQRWRAERLGYQQRIRQLEAQLHRQLVVPAP
jgi:hypothetical protein